MAANAASGHSGRRRGSRAAAKTFRMASTSQSVPRRRASLVASSFLSETKLVTFPLWAIAMP